MKPQPKAKDDKPWLQFRFCKNKCCLDTCKECGYWWADNDDNSLANQRAVFGNKQ